MMDAKIKCDSCNKNLLPVRFSSSAIKKYQNSLRANQRSSRNAAKLPRCMDCTGGNRVELRCVMCDQTFELEKFSKAQRKKKDDHYCLNCQTEKDDREPDFGDEVEEVTIMDEIKQGSHLGRGSSHYSSASSAATRSQLQSASDRYETETNPSSEIWADGNDAVSLAGSDSTYASSASTRITTGPQAGFATDRIPRRISSRASASTGNAGFVKQNAVGKNAEQRAKKQLARDEARQQLAQDQEERLDSDNESDEVDDDPY